MQKKNLMMLLASSIIIAGIFAAGCTDSSTSVETTGTLSAIPTLSQASDKAQTGDTGKPQFNESASLMGTRPDGLQMNATRPSGTPPDGMQMNGTHPQGGPGGMEMNGTRPSGTPPDGMQPGEGGNGPSGTPPSGTPPS